MNVITLRDYAKSNKISYEAVRKQVVRYAEELGDHIIRDGRQQFLDEEAVAFLDSKRQKNPVAIIQQSKDETISELTQENKNLLVKLATVQDELIEERKKTAALIEEQRERIDLLESDNAAAEAARVEAEGKVKEAEEKAEAEISAAHQHFLTEIKNRDEEHAKEIEERDLTIQEMQRAWQEYWALPFIKRIFAKKPEFPGEILGEEEWKN